MNTPAHTATFAVTGMSCEHCERAIRTELEPFPQITITSVSAASGTLVVSSETPVPTDVIIAAVAEAGYESALTESH